MQALDHKFIKTYEASATKHPFKYTTIVRHKGVVIAFAMDDQQCIYYNVLNLDRKVDSALDVNFWDTDPKELRFPQELNWVGYSAAGLTTLPVVKKDGKTEVDSTAVDDNEKDFFLSTTARLTADAPFQVLSDDKYVYVFRQSIDENDKARNLFDFQRKAIFKSVLLVDRFVFVDGGLKSKLETRFQRSRKKDQPDSAKDALGYEDLENKPFYEPTQVLPLVSHMKGGWFSVLLLPTSLPGVQRWQIFAYNTLTSRIDSFNIERSSDGLFNTRGTRYYTSPEPAFQKDVFERESGIDPFTGKELVPIVNQSGAAESAVALNGTSDYVKLPSADAITRIGDFTIELWLKADPAQVGTENIRWILDKGSNVGPFQFLLYYLSDTGKIAASRSDGTNLPTLTSNQAINDGKYHHIAYVKVGQELILYIDGEVSVRAQDTTRPTMPVNNMAPMYLGCSGGDRSFFKGEIDELRIWSRPRSLEEIEDSRHYRLVGNEPDLEGYWRFDEAAGNKVYDQSNNAKHGELASSKAWVQSTAPVGENPGVRRSSFEFQDRSIYAGCSALLYYQQETAVTGYNATAKPIKRNARVMFVVPTVSRQDTEAAQPTAHIAALDLAVTRDGNLVEIPDTLTLSDLDPKDRNNNSTSNNLEELSQLKQWIEQLETDIDQMTHLSIVGSSNGTVQVSKTYGVGTYDQNPFSEFHYQLELAIPQSLQVIISGEMLGQENRGQYEYFTNVSIRGGQPNPFADRHIRITHMQVQVITPDVLADKQNTLRVKRDRFQELQDTLKQEVKLKMPLQHVDDNGLTALGGLLKFAYTDHTPYLFENANGRLSLYFKGQHSNQFLAAYYDVLTGRATYTIDTKDVPASSEVADHKPVTFLARSSGSIFENSTITISNAEPNRPETCKVTITATSSAANINIQEVWNQVPRQPEMFADVLNGNVQPIYVGKLAATASNQIILEGRAKHAIAPGSILLVGEGKTKVATQSDLIFQATATALQGSVLEFDGIQDFVQLPTATELKLKNHDFTVSAWMRVSDISNPTGKGDRPILGTDQPREINQGLQLTLRDGKPRMGFFANDLNGDTLLTQNVWYYITWRYTVANGEQAIFVNGVLDESKLGQPAFEGRETVNIGRWNGDRYFKGQIAEVCIWSEARSDEQITADMSRTVLSDALLEGCWRFEMQDSKLVARDYSTYKRHGILRGQPRLQQLGTGTTTTIALAPANLATIKAGEPVYLLPYDYDTQVQTNQERSQMQNGSLTFRVDRGTAVENVQNGNAIVKTSALANQWFADSQGNALQFDGTAGLSVEAGDVFTAGDALTLEAWVKLDTVPPDGSANVVCHRSGGSNYVLGLGGTDTGKYHALAQVNDQLVEMITGSVSVGQWAHFAAMFNQSYALQFSGNQNVECGTDITLDLTDDLTIEAMIKLDRRDSHRAIISKGKQSKGIPYVLSVENNALNFIFEDENGGFQKFTSDASLNSEFCQVAVTRLKNVDPNGGKPETKYTISFYMLQQDGTKKSIGSKEYTGLAPRSSQETCFIGASEIAGGFMGAIAEVRIWNQARSEQDVLSKITGNEKGLISWWRIEEKQGNLVYDSKGGNHGTRRGATWIKSPDPRASEIQLYLNGEKQEVVNLGNTGGDSILLPKTATMSQFTLGAVKTDTGFEGRLKGQLDEIRVWKVVRTEEQIQDNMFRRIMDDYDQLITYYDCDHTSPLPDQSRHTPAIPVPNPNQSFALSTAPISNETARVRSALTGIATDFHTTTLASSPAVQEYGDMQTDVNGNLIGVMKRCYSYIDQSGNWQLITGFKVGDLELEWIGQAQYAPQLIGFIEGAPPVPSENLTVRDANQGEIYEQASVIELTDAEEVIYSYAESRDHGIETALSLKAGVGFASRTDTGVGVITSVEDTKAVVGITGHMETSNSWLNEQQVGVGKTTTKLSRLSAQGEWESEIQYPKMGRRYVPKNVGFALVQSETADVFALRLKHRDPSKRVTVALKMRPNPDIPKDWNIIIFPLNPTYVKQGTLDGMVGNVPEQKHYRHITGNNSDRSYFKPREAYALKYRIEKEQKELETIYQNFVTKPVGMNGGMKTLGIMGTLMSGGGVGIVGATLGTAIDGGIAFNDKSKLPDLAKVKRNLFNTYVWTADGGLFSETQQTMTFKQEVTAGSFSLAGMAGVYSEINTAISKFAVTMELEALMGGHISMTTQKSTSSQTDFGINVDLDVERNIGIQSPEQAALVGINRLFDADGNRVKCPGKVDAYRFMTFYLEPSTEHSKDFSKKVVDRAWLKESSDPNAIALRQAIGKENVAPWRVMHRVTYVSRVLSSEGSVEGSTESTLRAANIESNWELIKQLEPYIKPRITAKAISPAEFKQVVEQAIDRYLPQLASPKVKADIVDYLKLYYQIF